MARRSMQNKGLRSGLWQFYLHHGHRLVEPVGEAVEKGLGEPGLAPVVEDEPQVGKGTWLQVNEAIDVIFEAAQCR